MSALNIVADHLPCGSMHVTGYWLTNPDDSRVAQTFVNCGNDQLRASNNARLFASSGDLLAALIKAEDFISGFEGDELQEGMAELLAEIRTAIDDASPL